MRTIADRIQERLDDLGLQPTPASRAAGLSPSAIRNILEGKSVSPRADTLKRLASVLDTTPEWLDEGRGPKTSFDAALSKGLDITEKRAQEQDPLRRSHLKQPAPPALPPRQKLSPPNIAGFAPAPNMLNERMPVLGLAVGGPDGRFKFNGEVVEYVERPEFLKGVVGAYGAYIDGDSMFPRYKPGEMVWVNPNKTPRREDDVLVQLFPDEEGEPPEGYVKEFRAWTPKTLVLWQYNPAQEMVIERPLVKSVHVIVGRR